jgi:hypothetical protein
MPVHKLIIASLHAVFGYRAAPFFALALATHLLNTALLYFVLRHLVRAPLAAFGAALWGSAVVHQSSLDWFSVYGQILAATCLLVLLLDWVRSGLQSGTPSRAALLRWNLALLVAGTSFGIGIALAVAAPVVALAFVRRSQRRRIFLALLPAAIAVPALYSMAYAHAGGDRGPLAAPFLPAVGLRLLLELPAAGLASLLGPATTRHNASLLGGPLATRSFEDAFPIVRAAGFALALVVLVGFVLSTRPARRRMIGAALLCAAVYSLVAFGRTQLSLLTSPANIATEGRYHYTTLLGATLLVVLAASAIGRRLRNLTSARVAGGAVLLAWLSLVVVPSFGGSREVQRSTTTHAAVALRDTLAAIDAVIASAPPDRDVYILNSDYSATRNLFGVRNHPDRFPGIAALFALTHASDVVQGRRVHFVETRAEVLNRIRAQPERRISRLLVSNEEAQAGSMRVLPLPPPASN